MGFEVFLMKTNRSDEGVSGARKKRRKVPNEAGVAAEVTEVKAEAERETVMETKTGVRRARWRIRAMGTRRRRWWRGSRSIGRRSL